MRRSFRMNLGAGLDGLALAAEPIPPLGPRQVLVRVRALSLNYRELMIAHGWHPLPVAPDVIPVSDGASEVIEIGQEVTRVASGDRVTASIFPRWIAGRWSPEVSAQLGGSLDGMLTGARGLRAGETVLTLAGRHDPQTGPPLRARALGCNTQAAMTAHPCFVWLRPVA